MGTRTTPASPGSPAAPPQGMLRFTLESAILLAVAVTLFRTFFAEGYMISTGSMAPSLLGYHRQLCCPACQYQFERGAATESGEGALAADAAHDGPELDGWNPVSTRCPNCGSAVAESQVPRTEGDQLMVHKHHYVWRDPGRWEVVVFRNPELESQAYVKRTVGLPGETIELIGGDVYADGVLQRKPLAVQRSLRVPIDNCDYQPAPDDPDWRPRWRAESAGTAWRTDGVKFRFDAGAETEETSAAAFTLPVDWVQYHHWVRAGGKHQCRVPLAEWPIDVAEPGLLHSGFRYVPERRELESIGAIPRAVLDNWLDRVSSDDVRSALRTLYQQSHQPPLSDVCAYNHPESVPAMHPVHDLMLELTLTAERPDGEFVLALHDGCHELRCTLHLAEGVARLTADDKPTIHREAPLPAGLREGKPAVVTMSQFDRQVIVAVDGEPLFEPLLYAADEERPPLPEHPVRFGARGTKLQVAHVRLDRDVYYTMPEGDESRTFVLGENEFFMLGDNSPVSLDSRAWDRPAVPRELFIGRPFVVHLPSKPLRIAWEDRELFLRVPDWSRVRYIR